jgi:phosphate starvation-inducible membrane PsiE
MDIMKYLNFPEIILRYIINNPLKSKIITAIFGLIFGIFIPFAMPDDRFLFSWKILLIAIPFWTLGFAFFFIIYRLIIKNHKSDNLFIKYDIRGFAIIAFYYFVPHGLSSLLVFKIMNVHENGLGIMTIAGGISFYLSAKLSRIIIK